MRLVGSSTPRDGQAALGHITLLERQRDLLVELVRASLRQPGAARRKFLLALTDDGEVLLHPGLPGGQMALSDGDVHVLAQSGLVRTTRPRRDTISCFLTPLAVAYHDQLESAEPEQVQRIGSDLLRLIDSERFQQRYPDAHKKWTAAEALLWRDTDRELPKIGRLCRQAMYAFAFALVKRFRPAGTSVRAGDPVDQIRAVVGQQSGRLGVSRTALLEALIVYWAALADLLQRHERKAIEPREPINWEDARSVVLQTLMVFAELDRSLPR